MIRLAAAYANAIHGPEGKGLNFVELGSFALQNSISVCRRGAYEKPAGGRWRGLKIGGGLFIVRYA
jgi:hypothetical protein